MAQERDDAFQEQALELLDLMYGLAKKLCRNETMAQDLVQDTYFKAWKYKDSFKPGTSIKAWLYSILRNTFLNEIKRNKFTDSSVDIETLNLRSPVKQEPNEYYGDEMTLALQSLPEKQRSVLLLADVEEWSYEEVAKALGCPKNTVGTLLRRARAAMRQQLTLKKINEDPISKAPKKLGEELHEN